MHWWNLVGLEDDGPDLGRGTILAGSRHRIQGQTPTEPAHPLHPHPRGVMFVCRFPGSPGGQLCGEALLHRVNGALQLAQLMESEVVLELTPFCLEELVEEAFTITDSELVAKKLKVSCRFLRPRPHTWTHAHHTMR